MYEINRPKTCAICQGPTEGYHYGVPSCSGCKNFFKRAVGEKLKNGVKTCKADGKCFENLTEKRPNSATSKCKKCRLKKCKEVGMQSPSKESPNRNEIAKVQPKNLPKENAIENIPTEIVPQFHIDIKELQEIKKLHRARFEVYKVIGVFKNPSFSDLVIQNSNLKEYSRQVKIDWEFTNFRMKPWDTLGILVSVEVIKLFKFFSQLLYTDRITLLKNVAFKMHHLCIAYDSYARKESRVVAPTDKDIFPQCVQELPECKTVIKKLLTTTIEPILELELTEIEFLLLNMIVVCDPAPFHLSKASRDIIAKQRMTYTNSLLQVCLYSHGSDGPARFLKILEINNTLLTQKANTRELLDKLKSNFAPKLFVSNVIFESLESDFEFSETDKFRFY